MKRALCILILTGCPSPGPDTTSTETTTESTESTTEDTGDDNWGIVLDVGPPYYGTETGDET